MGRRYAGVLGSLAFATLLLRGILHGGGVQATLWQATLGMAALAVVGWFVGHVAQQTVEEAVRAALAEKLAQHQAEQKGAEQRKAVAA